MGFRKAERKKAKLRLALTGTSGSGKTYSSLLLAKGIGDKIALVDTENGSGELYANLLDYDVMQIEADFLVEKYVNAIREAEKAKYDVLIIDSLSHVWNGKGGLLEMREDIAQAKYKGNSWAAWKDVSPLYNRLVQAILQSNIHIIATMRSKTAYAQTEDKKIKKLGLAPVQREGLEYEFTLVFDIDKDSHIAYATKDRTGIFDNRQMKLNQDIGEELLYWLEDGKEVIKISTQEQRKEMFDMFKEAKMSKEEAIKYLKNATDKENSKDLLYDEVQGIMASLEIIIANQKAQQEQQKEAV